ncbi:hypothetical protein DFH06DRAFT_1142619 [Mycena polygramma]|nr:hypothetical protein DFH06DRAFT_1142619 [Mycena polygramma]
MCIRVSITSLSRSHHPPPPASRRRPVAAIGLAIASTSTATFQARLPWLILLESPFLAPPSPLFVPAYWPRGVNTPTSALVQPQSWFTAISGLSCCSLVSVLLWGILRQTRLGPQFGHCGHSSAYSTAAAGAPSVLLHQGHELLAYFESRSKYLFAQLWRRLRDRDAEIPGDLIGLEIDVGGPPSRYLGHKRPNGPSLVFDGGKSDPLERCVTLGGS